MSQGLSFDITADHSGLMQAFKEAGSAQEQTTSSMAAGFAAATEAMKSVTTGMQTHVAAAWDAMKAAAEGSSSEMTKALDGAVSAIDAKVSGLAQKAATGMLSGIADKLKTGAVAIATAAGAAFGPVGAAIGGTVSSALVQGIENALSWVGERAGELASQAFNAATKSGAAWLDNKLFDSGFWADAADGVSGLVGQLEAAADVANNSLVKAFDDSAEAMEENKSETGRWAAYTKEKIEAVGKAISEALKSIAGIAKTDEADAKRDEVFKKVTESIDEQTEAQRRAAAQVGMSTIELARHKAELQALAEIKKADVTLTDEQTAAMGRSLDGLRAAAADTAIKQAMVSAGTSSETLADGFRRQAEFVGKTSAEIAGLRWSYEQLDAVQKTGATTGYLYYKMLEDGARAVTAAAEDAERAKGMHQDAESARKAAQSYEMQSAMVGQSAVDAARLKLEMDLAAEAAKRGASATQDWGYAISSAAARATLLSSQAKPVEDAAELAERKRWVDSLTQSTLAAVRAEEANRVAIIGTAAAAAGLRARLDAVERARIAGIKLGADEIQLIDDIARARASAAQETDDTRKGKAFQKTIEAMREQVALQEAQTAEIGRTIGERERDKALAQEKLRLARQEIPLTQERLALVEREARAVGEAAQRRAEAQASRSMDLAIERQLANYQVQIDSLGKTAGEQARLKWETEQYQALVKAGIPITEEWAKKITASGVAAKFGADAMAEAQQRWALFQQTGQIVVSSLESTLGKFMSGTKVKWSEMVNDMIADLARLALRSGLQQLFGLGSSGGGIMGGLFSMFGGGRAQGGDVMPGVAYQWQERGNEYFIPTVPGTVMRHDQMQGGANMHVNSPITIDARGADASILSRLDALVENLPAMMTRHMIEMLDRHPRFARAGI